jgi:hypothetical protein
MSTTATPEVRAEALARVTAIRKQLESLVRELDEIERECGLDGDADDLGATSARKGGASA